MADRAARFVTIAPELEPRVRELFSFVPVERYRPDLKLLPNELGAAYNCRINIDDDGLTNFQEVKAFIIPKIRWSASELAEHARIDRDCARDNVKFWCFWGGMLAVLFLCVWGLIAINSGHACQ